MSLVKRASSESSIDPLMSEVQNQIHSNLSEPLTNSAPVRKIETVTQPVQTQTIQTAAPVVEPVAVQTQTVNAAQVSAPVATPSAEEKEPKAKSRYSDTLLLNLPVGKRNEIKEFFSNYNLSMTQGILFGLNYLMEDVKAGRIEISKLGIERK